MSFMSTLSLRRYFAELNARSVAASVTVKYAVSTLRDTRISIFKRTNIG